LKQFWSGDFPGSVVSWVHNYDVDGFDVQMDETHSDVLAVTDGIPGLNASLLLVNQHLDDVIAPSVDQLTANLRLADDHLTDSEENIANVASTWNASHLELTSQ